LKIKGVYVQVLLLYHTPQQRSKRLYWRCITPDIFDLSSIKTSGCRAGKHIRYSEYGREKDRFRGLQVLFYLINILLLLLRAGI
jgi:hypothetical protein